jgi:hypothetical protein
MRDEVNVSTENDKPLKAQPQEEIRPRHSK